ncbi:hypothetical protein H5410_019083 [Solanum commersonii]|uniref:Uncharacterized protein n=1 Tax=Solanum commersonii TaxID=4109 RepID=A0A9J6A4N4_SOLCO|nr:hypothetical protein H5410_019083 [Solanum commersonii]
MLKAEEKQEDSDRDVEEGDSFYNLSAFWVLVVKIWRGLRHDFLCGFSESSKEKWSSMLI